MNHDRHPTLGLSPLPQGQSSTGGEIVQGPASQFGIRSIPTMILFQNGREVARQSGAMNQAQISQWLQSKGIR